MQPVAKVADLVRIDIESGRISIFFENILI